MNPRIFGGMTAAVVSTLMLAQAANAQPTTPILPLDTAPRQFYVTLDADYEGTPKSNFTYLETCPMDSGNNLGDCVNGSKNTPYLNASHPIDSFGGGATFGYTLPTSWWGKRQRLELGFNYLSGERTDSRSGIITGDEPYVPGISRDLLLIGIDGGSFQRCGFLNSSPPNCIHDFNDGDGPVVDRHMAIYSNDDYLDVTSSAKTNYTEWNLVERILIDFDLAQSTTLTSNFGLIFRQNTTTIKAKASWVDPSNLGRGFDDTVLSSLYEQIKSRELGIELGSIVSYDLYRAIKLFGGVNLELLHQDGSLEGHDCLSREWRQRSRSCARYLCLQPD